MSSKGVRLFVFAVWMRKAACGRPVMVQLKILPMTDAPQAFWDILEYLIPIQGFTFSTQSFGRKHQPLDKLDAKEDGIRAGLVK